MRSGSTASRRKKIALCRRCRREILQREPGNHIAANRGENANTRGQKPDPRAEKIRQRKERKARTKQHVRDCAIMAALRSRDLHSANRIVLELKAERLTPATSQSEDCPECLKRQAAA